MAAPGPASKDMADVLQTAGLGTQAATSGWGIYVSKEPTTPDTTITLFDEGSFSANANAKFLLDHLSVEVRVRGVPFGYSAAYTKMQEVKDELLGRAAETVNGSEYIGIWMLGDISLQNYDENNRPILQARFLISREPSDTTNRVPLP